MEMIRVFLFVFLSALAAASHLRLRPHYLECVDSDECRGYECCVFVGKGLYSMPKCLPLSEIGAHCDSGDSGKPSNLTKYYPSGKVTFTNVFNDHCPCELGLTCDMTTETCEDPLARGNYNDIADMHFGLED